MREQRLPKRVLQIAGLLILSMCAVFGIQAAVGSSPATTFINPDAGKSDAERRQLHTDARANFDQKYRAWLDDFIKSGNDPRSLERIEISASYPEPLPDLDSAAKDAELIVRGVAKSVRFEPYGGAYVTLEVQQTVKGNSASKEIVIHQAGGPMPWRDYKSGYLAVGENEWLLLPGEEALLLLSSDRQPGTYRVQSFTGTYLVNAQRRVSALEGNPFAAELDNLPVDVASALVGNAAN
jgi:hypothetical protein